MAFLNFNNVTYFSKDRTILENITVDIKEGDFISIVGPSGSGKSTFLKLCCNLISPTKGKILFRNKDYINYEPTDLREKIAYCFQTPCLFGDTVMDNLSFPFYIRNEKIDMEKIYELFKLFKLNNIFIKSKIKNLSGGEKQRISLIRTLLYKPEILLLDEVTSALDSSNVKTVDKIINELNKQGITILWITHNDEESKLYANKIMTIENGKLSSLEVIR